MQIQISWLLKQPTDLELHFLQTEHIWVQQNLKVNDVYIQHVFIQEVLGSILGRIMPKKKRLGGQVVLRCHVSYITRAFI